MTNACVTTLDPGESGSILSPRKFFTIQGSEIASEISFEPKQ